MFHQVDGYFVRRASAEGPEEDRWLFLVSRRQHSRTTAKGIVQSMCIGRAENNVEDSEMIRGGVGGAAVVYDSHPPVLNRASILF